MDYVRNKEGIWINSNLFRERAIDFEKNGYYCPDPAMSPAWFDFWTEERNRCLRGYSVGGAQITGNHYFYLNYCPIQKVISSQGRRGVKGTSFPDFWDGDYNFFWIREIARNGILSAIGIDDNEVNRIFELPEEKRIEIQVSWLKSLQLFSNPKETHLNGGLDLIVGKARRKGYSFKNASIGARNYFHIPESYTMYMAYDSKYLYPKGIFSMTMNYINFINENTAWTMPSDVIRRQDHIKASYISHKEGIKLEKGFKSEVQAISFKDNPDAGRGKDAIDIMGEEVGAWGTPGGLKATLSAIRPSTVAGSIKTGLITLFGTSGDVESGTVDFADIMSRPEAFGFLPFTDVWTDSGKTEGFFHPTQLNMEGFYDENGNSDIKGATALELKTRELLVAAGAVSSEIQQRMQEFPLNSAEAFAIISVNNFPVIELKQRLEIVKAKNIQKDKGVPVEFYRDENNKVNAKPILNGKVEPITSYFNVPSNLRGCPVIYEFPADPPRGLYKIGYDPVRQDTGTSLAAIIVYKGVHSGSLRKNIIAAEYIGRLETAEDVDKLLEYFCDYYNTTAMHENEVTSVKNYFRRIKRLDLLAMQPDSVISKNVKNSSVSRVYGCHMTEQLKDAGERYIKEWLLDVVDFDEHGNPIRNLDNIESQRLLEELIAYSRKGNFDLVSSLIMCMFQVQEEMLGKVYEDNPKNPKWEKISRLYKNKINEY